jgi:outer membrane receptor for ferric coprogen and ferric-rhodotorulic acid
VGVTKTGLISRKQTIIIRITFLRKMTLSFLLRSGVQEYQATSTQDYVMTARVICKRPALLYALAAAFPLASLAEETVIVTAQPVDSAVSPTQGYSARTSTGATKTDRPLITTAQSVSVITRQQMADRGANTSARRWNIPRGLLQLRRRRNPL